MHFEDLVQFLERDMRMSHVYQPVDARTATGTKGSGKRPGHARALLNEDRSQLEYYSEITKIMVVVCRHDQRNPFNLTDCRKMI